jgi:hypothetical protein
LKRFEVMLAIMIEAESADAAKLIAEEVMPVIGYANDDAEIMDVIVTGEPMETTC